jgi:hypothetical protein
LTHDYPLFASSAKELGLPISTDAGRRSRSIKLYPQPTRMQNTGGVEYPLVPRRREIARRT